jgi:hypothetical protein
VNIEGLPHLERWLAAIAARPAVKRGRAVPERLDLGKDAEEFVRGAQKILV